MSNTQPYYLVPPEDGAIPNDKLTSLDSDKAIPSRTLSETEESGTLPASLPPDTEESSGSDDGMHVRLTAEEPTIPEGRLKEQRNTKPGDIVELPGQYIREERRMPRLH